MGFSLHRLYKRTAMEQSERILATLQRDLNCLVDPDRSTRRRALERLQKQLLQGEANNSPAYLADLQVAWDDTILKKVLKALCDSVEKCRELAIHLINGVVNKISKVDQTVALVVPLIAERMGQLPLLEKSEEVRLEMINFLGSECMRRCSGDTLKLVVGHLIQVLCISLGDQFHEIKKGASRAIVMLTELAGEEFSEMSEKLLRALLPNIGHAHSKVRIATLEAINSVVLCGLPAGIVGDVLVPAVRVLGMDRTIAVRKTFFVYIAGWLGYRTDNKGTENLRCNANVVDPRTYAPQLLPLLLLGLSDESADIAEMTLNLVEGVGEVYLKFDYSSEYMHAKMADKESVSIPVDSDNFSTDRDGLTGNDQMRGETKIHFQSNSVELKLPPPYKGRPGRGCRLMIQHYLGQLIYPVKKDLKQWTSNVRLGAACMLHALLILGEEKMVDYLDTLVPSLCCAVGDDDLAVARKAIDAIHVLGYNVSPDYWLSLVLDQVIPSTLSHAEVANGVVVLANLLYGTPIRSIKEGTVGEISKQLCCANLGLRDHPAIKQQLLAVLENLIEKGGALCLPSCLEISILLLQLQSFDDDRQIQQHAALLMNNLACAVGLVSGKELYARHTEALLGVVTAGYSEWLGSSSGTFLFKAFIQNAGNCVGPYLETLLQVFSDCLNPEKDPALRLCFVELLDKLFEMDELGIWWQPHALQTIGGLLLPCSVWHIGKVAAEIRHRAMSALGTFLRRDLCSKEHLVVLLHSQQLLLVVTACLEEDYSTDTRRVSCCVIEHIVRKVGSVLDDVQITVVSKSLQKRLDDSSDAVRLGILPAISNFLSVASSSARNIDIKGFLSNLILHMDDPNEQIQEAVYAVIENYTLQRPELVLEVVKSARERHQNVRCDQLWELATSIQSRLVQ